MSETDSAEEGSGELNWGWTRTHRVGIAVLTGLILVMVGIEYYRRPILFDTLRVEPATEAVAELIDPNTATEAQLTHLPKIGPTIAARIVAYRTAVAAENRGQPVFLRLQDLRNVQGIGKKTIEALRGFVSLSDDEEAAGTEAAAATEPAGN